MRSPARRLKVVLTLALALSIAACATPKDSVPDRDADMPCPEWTSRQLGLTVSLAPISIPPALSGEGAVQDYGTQARRISIAVTPHPASFRMRLFDSSLSIYIFGGIFRGWVSPADENTRTESKVSPAIARSRIVSSSQALELLPGRVMVTERSETACSDAVPRCGHLAGGRGCRPACRGDTFVLGQRRPADRATRPGCRTDRPCGTLA